MLVQQVIGECWWRTHGGCNAGRIPGRLRIGHARLSGRRAHASGSPSRPARRGLGPHRATHETNLHPRARSADEEWPAANCSPLVRRRTHGHRVRPTPGRVPLNRAVIADHQAHAGRHTRTEGRIHLGGRDPLRLLHAAEHDLRAAGRPAHAAAEPLLAPAAELCATRGDPHRAGIRPL